MRGHFIITNGEHLWNYESHEWNKASDKGEKEQKKLVSKSSMAGLFSMQNGTFKEMLGTIVKEQAKFGTLPEKHGPERTKNPKELGMYEFRIHLPVFVFTPFAEINREDIIFKGEEAVNGGKTYHFLVEESMQHQKSEHWVGAADGIPRKIIEYKPVVGEVDFELELKNVTSNIGLQDKDFQFEAHDEYEVQDMDQTLEKMPELKELFMSLAPEKIFEGIFSTPLEKTSQLKGTGNDIGMAYEFYIRFKCEEEVAFKEKINFTTVPPEEAAAWFLQAFPEDKEYLSNFNDLKCFSYEEQYYKTWYLINTKNNIYYFRVWGSHG